MKSVCKFSNYYGTKYFFVFHFTFAYIQRCSGCSSDEKLSIITRKDLSTHPCSTVMLSYRDTQKPKFKSEFCLLVDIIGLIFMFPRVKMRAIFIHHKFFSYNRSLIFKLHVNLCYIFNHLSNYIFWLGTGKYFIYYSQYSLCYNQLSTAMFFKCYKIHIICAFFS